MISRNDSTRRTTLRGIAGLGLLVALSCSSTKQERGTRPSQPPDAVFNAVFKLAVGSKPLKANQAEIAITVPRSVTEFEAPSAYGGAPVFVQYLSNVAAHDSAGLALPVTVRGNRVLVNTSASGAGTYTLSYLYDVPQSKAGEIDLSLPTLDAKHGRFDNNLTFLRPKDISDVPAELIVSAPEGVPVVTSWGEGRTAHVPHVEKLASGMIVLGDYSYSSEFVGSTRVLFAIRGDYNERILKKQFAQVLASEQDIVGTSPSPFLLVVFQDSTQEECKGTALTNAFLVNIKSGTKLEPFNFQAIGTIAHELFHQWNAVLVRPLSDDGVYLLTEGFTNYFAIAALTRAELIPSEGFARFLWRYRSFLEKNPRYPAADYASIQEGFAIGDRDLRDLAYTKGPFVAVLLDQALREDTNGAQSIASWFRALVARFGGTKGYVIEDLRKLTASVSGKPNGKAASVFERAFLGRGALELDDLFSALGIACEADGSNCKLAPRPEAEAEARAKLFTARM